MGEAEFRDILVPSNNASDYGNNIQTGSYPNFPNEKTASGSNMYATKANIKANLASWIVLQNEALFRQVISLTDLPTPPSATSVFIPTGSPVISSATMSPTGPDTPTVCWKHAFETNKVFVDTTQDKAGGLLVNFIIYMYP